MISPGQLLILAAQNYFSRQMLDRIPETDLVMSTIENVEQFNKIIDSNISVSFCGAIELLHKIEALPCTGHILDLACGPGHFTLLLAKYSGADRVIGVDLSEPMLEKARSNAESMGLTSRVDFIHGDVTDLHQFSDQQFDLITCTNSAHHLPTLELLQKMFCEAERLMAPQGTAFIMDLTRLATSACSRKYIAMMGEEYLSHGLDKLYEDFRNSMYAAWTPTELCSAIPLSKKFRWHYFSLFPLPINQFLFAKPKSWQPSNQNHPFEWPDSKPPLRDDLVTDYHLYRRAAFFSYQWLIKRFS